MTAVLDRRRLLGARASWRLTARADQVTPPGDWAVWLLLAGRGFGKTRVLVEDGAKYAVERPDVRVAIVAATHQDARQVILEGESGLLTTLRRYGVVKDYNRSVGTVELTNGSLFSAYSAEKPDRLRGPQHHRALCDELAAWQRPETWDQLQFGLRLGSDPRTVVATTPRPVPLVRELVKRIDVHVTRGSTFDNAANLAPTFLEQVRTRYEGTRLGRQELYAEVLDDVEGALWGADLLRQWEGDAGDPPLSRVIVSVDPSGSADGDACGIVAVGVDETNPAGPSAIVLADATISAGPEERAEAACLLAYRQGAGTFVVEGNYGGDLFAGQLRSSWAWLAERRLVRGMCPAIEQVTARGSKADRAAPVVQLYEQGRVWHAPTHAGALGALEEELTTWTPLEKWSPNRLDALVHGVRFLLGDGASKARRVSVPTSRWAALPTRR